MADLKRSEKAFVEKMNEFSVSETRTSVDLKKLDEKFAGTSKKLNAGPNPKQEELLRDLQETANSFATQSTAANDADTVNLAQNLNRAIEGMRSAIRNTQRVRASKDDIEAARAQFSANLEQARAEHKLWQSQRLEQWKLEKEKHEKLKQETVRELEAFASDIKDKLSGGKDAKLEAFVRDLESAKSALQRGKVKGLKLPGMSEFDPGKGNFSKYFRNWAERQGVDLEAPLESTSAARDTDEVPEVESELEQTKEESEQEEGVDLDKAKQDLTAARAASPVAAGLSVHLMDLEEKGIPPKIARRLEDAAHEMQLKLEDLKTQQLMLEKEPKSALRIEGLALALQEINRQRRKLVNDVKEVVVELERTDEIPVELKAEISAILEEQVVNANQSVFTMTAELMEKKDLIGQDLIKKGVINLSELTVDQDEVQQLATIAAVTSSFHARSSDASHASAANAEPHFQELFKGATFSPRGEAAVNQALSQTSSAKAAIAAGAATAAVLFRRIPGARVMDLPLPSAPAAAPATGTDTEVISTTPETEQIRTSSSSSEPTFEQLLTAPPTQEISASGSVVRPMKKGQVLRGAMPGQPLGSGPRGVENPLASASSLDSARQRERAGSAMGDTQLSDNSLSSVSSGGGGEESVLQLPERTYTASPDAVGSPIAGAEDLEIGGGLIQTPEEERQRARQFQAEQLKARRGFFGDLGEGIQQVATGALAQQVGGSILQAGGYKAPEDEETEAGPENEADMASQFAQQQMADMKKKAVADAKKKLQEQLQKEIRKLVTKSAQGTTRIVAEEAQAAAAPADLGATLVTLIIELNVQLISKYVLKRFLKIFAKSVASGETAEALDMATEVLPEQTFAEDFLTIFLDCFVCFNMLLTPPACFILAIIIIIVLVKESPSLALDAAWSAIKSMF
jgi:hypothetical protein